MNMKRKDKSFVLLFLMCTQSAYLQIKIFIHHSTNCNMMENTQQIMDEHKLFPLGTKQHTNNQPNKKKREYE